MTPHLTAAWTADSRGRTLRGTRRRDS
jgi:hypothetical protein